MFKKSFFVKTLKVIVSVIIAITLIFMFLLNRAEKTDNQVITDQLTVLENNFKHSEEIDTAVSQVRAAWHLDHSLKVVNQIYDSLDRSNPDQYQSNWNFTRMIVFVSGKMPRGRGQSPASVRPPEVITKEDLYQQLKEAQAKVLKIDALPENSNFNHPVFGRLNRAQAKRFIAIHTEHHLKIVKDILSEG